MSSNNVRQIPAEGCSGCTACESICPTEAIRMKSDEQGFLYPLIEDERCISCGLCLKVCPYSKETNRDALSYHAVKSTDVRDRLSSSSGGFASILAEYVINNDGSAYGVVETDNFEILTVRATSTVETEKFRGSKYVQSNLCSTFREAADDLQAGMHVVFFASSCHIDGLIQYLRQAKVQGDRLITVDFICHGVPSPKVFKSYAEYGKQHKDMTRYLFRTKFKGWGNGSREFCPCVISGVRQDRYKYDSLFAWAWLDMFFSNNCLRPHCYQCPYAGKGRAADLTMADFWGLSMSNPDFFDKNGVSLVVVNTEKGYEALKALQKIAIVPSDFDSASKKQANMFNPSKKGDRYEEFWSDYQSKKFSYVLRKYTRYNCKYMIKKVIKKIINKK